MPRIRKVIIIHKTHLDIGFTNSAKEVLKQYIQHFIPSAIRTASEVNQDGKRRFVWTVGSFLIDEALKGENHTALEEAIRRGDIAWHALPCTTHTELMDETLAQFAVDIGRKLDKRFGRNTIAAKMTDVPGHTQALIPYLVDSGVRYLHIGVNPASRLPDVPTLCRWRYTGREIILHYAKDYGTEDVFGDCVLYFAHAGDNFGAPTPEGAMQIFQKMERKYPGAEVTAGTLDDFALEVLRHVKELPIFEKEIGDTWIHGIASDPFKIGAYREALALHKQWMAEEPQALGSATEQAMLRNLLLVCEHTWGRDIKTGLGDYRDWSKADFQQARLQPHIDSDAAIPAGQEIASLTKQILLPNASFALMDESWCEQREYVKEASACLPQRYQEEATSRLAALKPEMPEPLFSTGKTDFEFRGIQVQVQSNGWVRIRHEKKELMLALRYEVYGSDTVRNCYEQYNRQKEKTYVWSWPDFGKPGLETAQTADETYLFLLSAAQKTDCKMTLAMRTAARASDVFGAPREMRLEIVPLAKGLDINVSWYQKDASRIPEALYLDFCQKEPENILMKKIDFKIEPGKVCKGGNTHLHCTSEIQWGNSIVLPVHTPLCDFDGAGVYAVDNPPVLKTKQISFVLYNNRWGTNFPLYYSENAAMKFRWIWNKD